MPSKLAAVVAAEKGVKNNTKRTCTEAYHAIQRLQAMTGHTKSYQPHDDDGEQLPTEFVKVQYLAMDKLKESANAMADLFNITATKDWGNCLAKADVIVDDKVILSQVPITYLLFLKEQLENFHTEICKLPIHDASETWDWSDANGCYISHASQAQRTKQIIKPIIMAPATDKHPAQVQAVNETVQIGMYTTIKMTGTVPRTQALALKQKVEALQKAVTAAMEDANGLEVEQQFTAKPIFDYLLG